MGLPAYIINRDELKQIIIQCLKTTSLMAQLVDADFSNTEINIETANIEGILNNLITILDTQQSDYSDLFMGVSDLYNEIMMLEDMYIQQTESVDSKLQTVLNEYQKIIVALQGILEFLSASGGRPKGISLRGSIPSSKNTVTLNWSANEKIRLTSIQIVQDSYNFEDYWDLKVKGVTIFSNVYTKYTMEKKSFATPIELNSSDSIQILFYNKSGKQKTINYDIDFLVVD